MKKLFKKSLAICLMAALVLSAVMGAMVVSAEGVVATKGAVTGSIEFLYNTAINFGPVDGATAYGAEVYRTDKGEWTAVDVVFASAKKADTVVGISNISLNNINKTFTFKPYAVVEEVKVYAEAFTSSYAEWLVSRKDGNRLTAEINNILDTYASITGETVYDGQVADLEAAPEIDADDKWVAADAGNAAVKGSFNLGDGKNYIETALDIDYPLSGFETTAIGDDMVVNGDFANGQTGWLTWPQRDFSFENGEAGTHVGTYIWNETPYVIEDNTNYRVTFKLRSEATDASAIDFEFALQNGREINVFTETSAIAAHNGHDIQDFDACINGNTVTYTFDFNTGTLFNLTGDHAAKNNWLYIAFRTLGSSDWIYIDDVTFHKADMSTPFGPETVIDNGFDNDGLCHEWIGTNSDFEGALSDYHGAYDTAAGGNPIDGSRYWAWLSDNNHTNGTKVTIKPNTYYTFSADIYVPEGKTIGFAIHNGDTYKSVDMDNLIMRTYYNACAWKTVSYTFYSGDWDGRYWLTVYNWGTYSGDADSNNVRNIRVRFDSVKILECGAGALVYKDGNQIADVKFAANNEFAVSIANISFANMAKQYTIVPYTVANDGAATLGEEVVISYADFLAHALNNGNDAQKAQAYAIAKAYKAAYGVDLVEVQKPVNLVVNGSFEEDLKGWTTYKDAGDNGGVGVFHADDDKTDVLEATDGGYAAQIFAFKGSIYQNIKVEKNTTYKLSFDYRTGRCTKGEEVKDLWTQFFMASTAEPINDYATGTVTQNGLGEMLEWSHHEFEINSGDNEYIYICWYQTRDTRWGSYSIETIERSFLDNVKLIEVQ